MNKLSKYFGSVMVVAAMALIGCNEVDFTAPNAAGLPQANDYADAINISVDPETNEVTFTLDARGVMPVWIIDGKKYSTTNGLRQIYAAAGDYEIEVKILNANGMSDGSVFKTFHIENSIVDYTKYVVMLAGDGTREWRIDNSAPGHLGCGEPGTDGTNWWSAGADEKASEGLYDNRLTFDRDYVYTFNPGDAGTMYVNKDVTVFPERNPDQDYRVTVPTTTATYSFDVKGSDLFLVLPAGTPFPYIPNDDFYNNPRLKVMSLNTNTMELVADNGGIAWHMTLTSKGAVKAFDGFKYDSDFNIWKSATIENPTFWYAPNWNQIADPAWSLEGNTYTFNFPVATTDTWQGQVHIATNIALTSATNYDFSCIINTSCDHPHVTIKLTEDGDDGNFLFAETVSTKAYEDYVFYMSDVPGIDASKVKLVLDFGGNADNTEATVRRIVLKDHANDDGTVLPSEEPAPQPGDVVWNEEGPANMWRSCTFNNTFYYAIGDSWEQQPDPVLTTDGYSYHVALPVASKNQWQAQVHFHTDMTTSAGTNYDFRVVLNSTKDIQGVTVKLTQDGDDGNFYFTDRIDLKAYEEYVFTKVNMEGIDMPAINLVFDFGGNPDDTEVTISGIVLQEHAGPMTWDPADASNFWRSCTFNNTFYYAIGDSWEQQPDPVMTIDGYTYHVALPVASKNQWQAQVHFHTDMTSSADTNYDFHVVLNSTTDIQGATIKLTQDGDDGNFFFTERVDLKAYEDFEFSMVNMAGIDMPAINLVFDFGGNPDNTEVTISDIVFKKH